MFLFVYGARYPLKDIHRHVFYKSHDNKYTVALISYKETTVDYFLIRQSSVKLCNGTDPRMVDWL